MSVCFYLCSPCLLCPLASAPLQSSTSPSHFWTIAAASPSAVPPPPVSLPTNHHRSIFLEQHPPTQVLSFCLSRHATTQSHLLNPSREPLTPSPYVLSWLSEPMAFSLIPYSSSFPHCLSKPCLSLAEASQPPSAFWDHPSPARTLLPLLFLSFQPVISPWWTISKTSL